MSQKIPTRTREDAEALLERSRTSYLRAARAAIRLFASRTRCSVTIDDVRRIAPPPPGIDGRVLGVVFQPGAWKPVGYVAGRRPESHRRPIMAYRLAKKRAA